MIIVALNLKKCVIIFSFIYIFYYSICLTTWRHQMNTNKYIFFSVVGILLSRQTLTPWKVLYDAPFQAHTFILGAS